MSKKKQRRPATRKPIYNFWVPIKIIGIFLAVAAVVSLVLMCGCRE